MYNYSLILCLQIGHSSLESSQFLIQSEWKICKHGRVITFSSKQKRMDGKTIRSSIKARRSSISLDE